MMYCTCARGLLAGGIGIAALTGAAGTAHADPDSAPPPAPTIDQILTQTLLTQSPSLFANPADRGRPSEPNWDDVGMYCENLYVKCR